MLDIVEYLEEKGHWVKQKGSRNVHTHCPVHGEDVTAPGRLYINVDENDDKWGLWTCFRCGAKGGINALRQHFGDAPLEGVEAEKYNHLYQIAANYYSCALFDHPEAYEYLTQARGLSDDTIVQARIGWCDGGLANHLREAGHLQEDMQASGLVDRYGQDTYRNQLCIPYLSYGNVTQLRFKPLGQKTVSMWEVPTEMYGVDSIIGEDTVVIAEGEIDQLTLRQMGFPAVGIPGALSWKQAWTEHLEDVKRFYIIYDSDGAGKRGAEKVAAALGPRARIVEMPKKKIDVNDWYVKHGKRREDFDYLFSKAKGGLLVTVQEAYERWTEIEGNDRLAGLRTNIDPLDRAMHFGLLPGQVMTLLARTGVGKSIWSINLFHRMRMANPDVKILFASLEQGRNEWFERAHRIHNFYEPGATVVDTINYWKDNILILDKNRITDEELEDSIDQYSYDLGKVPDLICVDYLGYYARSFPGNEKEKTIAAIMGLKSMAREYGTVIYTPHQANRTGQLGGEVSLEMAKDSSAVEETSDLMLTVWAPDHRIGNEENTGEIYQKLVKSRNGGVGSQFRYQYAPLTLAMVPIEDPLYRRALAEKNWAAAGDNWKEAVERHKTGSTSLSPLTASSFKATMREETESVSTEG